MYKPWTRIYEEYLGEKYMQQHYENIKYYVIVQQLLFKDVEIRILILILIIL